MAPIRVLVVGCGNMGASHARAYHQLAGFEIVGLVSRKPSGREGLAKELAGPDGTTYPTFGSFEEAMGATSPDAVSVNTYPDTHYPIAMAALGAGAHVFMEKPLAETVAQAEEIAALAQAKGLKVVVGYILRVHPAWEKFIGIAQGLGKPLVMRMNLNQQSSGKEWETHKSLMQSMSPIVDCGVHYVDVMCQMTRSKPLRVSAIGARLTDEIPDGMYNYGQLQVAFEDGSVGWYEAGWGPMMSETAFFVKDVIGPDGCVSIVDRPGGDVGGERSDASAKIDDHTKTNSLKVHHAARKEDGGFAKADEWVDTTDEPDHDGLCLREQEVFLRAIVEDQDLTDHVADAINSLRIVLAADQSFRSGRTVDL